MDKVKRSWERILQKVQAGLNEVILKKRLNIIFERYKAAFNDINNGVNLDKWNKDVSEAIKEIELIEESGNGMGYEKLKNELYYLKYLIAEKS